MSNVSNFLYFKIVEFLESRSDMNNISVLYAYTHNKSLLTNTNIHTLYIHIYMYIHILHFTHIHHNKAPHRTDFLKWILQFKSIF